MKFLTVTVTLLNLLSRMSIRCSVSQHESNFKTICLAYKFCIANRYNVTLNRSCIAKRSTDAHCTWSPHCVCGSTCGRFLCPFICPHAGSWYVDVSVMHVCKMNVSASIFILCFSGVLMLGLSSSMMPLILTMILRNNCHQQAIQAYETVLYTNNLQLSPFSYS